MPKESKPSKRVIKALELYKAWSVARMQHFSSRKIVNSPLPVRKQKYFERLYTQCIVRFRNAASAFDSHYKKMSESDRIQFYELQSKVGK